jgi:hypothetical protein
MRQIEQSRYPLCNNRAMHRKPLIDKGFVKNLEYCSMLPTND